MNCQWEHFYHEADVGIRGIGATLDQAFAGAAQGMMAAITQAAIEPKQEITINCEAPEPELLLVDWLNALIYEIATRNMLFSDFEVSIEGNRLVARCRGEPIDPARHHPGVEVKGATYTELSVRRQGDHWIAQTVVDV